MRMNFNAVMLFAALAAGASGVSAANNRSAPLAVVEAVGQRVRIDVPASVGYPTMARDLRLEGRAVVRATVGEGGRATKVQIAESSGSRYLDQAALRAVRRSHFVVMGPATGLAVNVPVDFALPQMRVADY